MASWLDDFFGPSIVKVLGVLYPKRPTINFVAGTGTAVAATDDPTNNVTNVTIGITGGGGVTAGARGQDLKTLDSGAGPAVVWANHDLATLANASTGAINDLVSTDANANPVGAFRFSGAAPVLNGIASGTDDRKIALITTGGPLVINNLNTGSIAANRIVTGTGGSLTLPSGSAILLVYDATSSLWRVAGSPPPAVIFDGGTTTSNARTARSANQSPINNTQNGIVNLGSDTTGATVGATANYSTVSGGDQNVISTTACTYSTIGGGIGNVCSGNHDFIGGGSTNTCSGNTATIAGGQGNIASGNTSAIGGGINNQATVNNATVVGGTNNVCSGQGGVCGGGTNTCSGTCAVAFGNGNTASGPGATALGQSANATRPNQHTVGGGQFAALGDCQVTNAYQVFGTHTGTGTVVLTDANATQFAIPAGVTYAIRAVTLVQRTDAAGTAMAINDILVNRGVSGGPGASVGNNNITLAMTAGLGTIAFSIVSNNLTATYTGAAGQTVRVSTWFQWIEIAGGF